MERNRWTCSTLLSAAALESLHAINRLYLELLAAGPQPRCSMARPSLLDTVAGGLARLSAERRTALAGTPFSLFDAHFGDGAFWTQLTMVVREPAPPGLFERTLPFTVDFAQMALFYAWHLARLEPFAARVLLGMSAQTQRVFAGLPLPYLQQIALEQPQLIEPRWSDRDTVWRILLGAAHRGPEHLACVHLFGIQLSAGDLSEPQAPGKKGFGK